MDDRLKRVLQKELELGDIDLVDEFRETDMNKRDFTLALAKQYPFQVDRYDFQLFTKPYVTQLIENAKIYFAGQTQKGVYATVEEYQNDFALFEEMMLEKVASRKAFIEESRILKEDIKNGNSKVN